MLSGFADRALRTRVFRSARIRDLSLRLAAVVLAVAACQRADTPLSPEPKVPPPIHDYLTGEAVQALQPNGELRLAPGESPDGTPMITAERAIELANAYVRTFGRFFKAKWERERGAPLNLATVSAAPRVYFVHTPYAAFPEGFHPAFKRWYGPWYQVTLTSRGLPVIQMAVSAYLTDYDVTPAGDLDIPVLHGNDFVHMGISPDAEGFSPLGPEEAVALVAQASGARIERVPELVLRGAFTSPLVAVWRVGLDQEVSVGIPANGRRDRELFVGPMGRRNFFVAAPDQPAFEHDFGRRISSQNEPLTVEQVQVPVRPGHVVKFEEVQVAER